MSEWNVQQADAISTQPKLVRAAHLAMADMIREGTHPGDSLDLESSDSVVWVEADGQVVGMLLYKHLEWNVTTWVHFAFVLPECRQHGVWRAMNARVEAIAVEKKMARIGRSVELDNANMHAAMMKHHYLPRRTSYEKVLR